MHTLFNNLMALSDSSECFYYTDTTSSMLTDCRLFGYRFIPSSDVWLQPDATESRGILFEMENGKPVKILARPMSKFFNLNENEQTQAKDLDLESAEVYEKADGSLISIYFDKALTTKTINSLFSDQALAASRLLHSDLYSEFYEDCLDYAEAGYTINCEYVAPDNQVILYYNKPELKVLNVRHNLTGEYVKPIELEFIFKDKYLKPLDMKFSEQMYNEINKEGYVLELKSGQRVKVKTHWYVDLHRMKDNLTSDTKIINQIIDQQIDDVIPLLNDSPRLKKKIELITNFISKKLFSYYQEIMDYHQANSHKTRKQYASEFNLAPYLMSPSMKLYEGSIDQDKVIDLLKDHIKKYNKMYSDELYDSGVLEVLNSDLYGNGL